MREASKRVLALRPSVVQLIGGMLLDWSAHSDEALKNPTFHSSNEASTSSSSFDSNVNDDDYRVELYRSFVDPISIVLSPSDFKVSEPITPHSTKSSSVNTHAEDLLSAITREVAHRPTDELLFMISYYCSSMQLT
ncbi:hypothetical protein L1987_33576 [Smallanthus sonchifolius]|uniref:Uncharacterized protein n=1 Tax=Smallanthus sonchifolius TaxID=185202 RepID=A0ACB9HT45_9ASTR|nr:hypothetical protein L1987_33576 [Smallanthus sonchifolius]